MVEHLKFTVIRNTDLLWSITTTADIPNRNATIIAASNIQISTIDTCHCRCENEMLVGLPQAQRCMVVVENLEMVR